MPTLDLEHLTLARGSHDPDQGEGCVMEWVSVAAGEEWSDHPQCTSPVIAAFLRTWQDALGDDDRQTLKRFIPVIAEDGTVISAGVMGTRTTAEAETVRAWMCTDWLVRVQAPAWLRLAGLTEQADILASMVELTPETCPSIMPALKAAQRDAYAARDAARAAAGAAAWAAAWDAAWAAAGDAAWDAAWAAAGDAAWDAAGDAARAAAGAAAWAAAGAAAGAAAWDALSPTVVELRASALELVDRMIVVGAGVSA